MTDRARLDTLAPEELGRLVDRLRRARREGEASGSIPTVPRDQSAWSLSPTQERIWFLERLSPGAATYNIATCFRLKGDLSLRFLDQGFITLSARHEILRTRFVAINGEPCQVLDSKFSLGVSVVDLRALGTEASQQEAMDQALTVAREPIALDHAPLARVVLLRLREEDLLVVVLHHLLADELSAARLLQELGEAYSAPLESRPPRLQDLTIQYLDFSQWQRKRIADGDFEKQVAFWREQLAEAPATNSLPYDRPARDFSSADGGAVSLPFPASLMTTIESFARSHQATPFMVLTSAIAGLLCRYSGDQDQTLATPVANRGRRELEGVIGCFVNTLILRSRWSGSPGLRELLEQMRRTVTQATAHQDVPFEHVVRELAPERSLSRSPWAQILVTLETQLGSLKLAGLRTDRLDLAIGAAKMDLTLAMRPSGEQLRLFMEYRREVFDEATVERFGVRLLRVLGVALEDVDRPIETLDLLSHQERETVLRQWGRGQAVETLPPLFPDLWQEVCQRQPQAEALRFGDETVTYGELQRRVQSVAEHLGALGAAPEQLVGVMMPRSSSLVAAMVGVLRSGAAYLPLDPAYPSERIRFMLEDSGASVLLTTEGIAKTADWPVPHVVFLDEVLGGGSGRPGPGSSRLPREVRHRLEAESLAYLIYTSGSTGRPKGVAITHGSLTRLAHWARDVFSEEELSGILAATSICFDLSIFELLVPLALGGRVILVEDALALGRLPKNVGVRLVNTVPSAIAELARAEAIPPSVSTVNLAGEALSRELVEELYKGTRVQRVLNLYGPSEDTTYSTWAVVPPIEEASPPIGQPLPETQAFVLDGRLQPAFPETAGELFLGGRKLARGYWGRPGLTAERFLPDPFSGSSGGRLYRTGDRVRFRDDGNLDFLGRLDHQIKHRGFRVELGEIEARLGEHSKVREAAGVVQGHGSDGHLIAFVVAEEGEEEVAGEDLKCFLRDRLPDFMVPGSFVWLPRLPRTANGKIDRRALPENFTRRAHLAPPVAPRTWREHQVCAHFQELLATEPVGLHDDFFALGGHSLLAFRLALRLRESCGYEVSLKDIFERPTVAGLAQLLEDMDQEGASRRAQRPGLKASGKWEGPLSFEQERLWFLEQLGERSGLYNLPLALSLRGRLSHGLLDKAWRELFQRQTALGTEIFLESGKPRQRIQSLSPPELCLVDLSALSAPQRQRVESALKDRTSGSPLPLGEGPLVRLLLLRRQPEDHLLLGAAHHIVADGRSLGIFMSELAEIFSARHEGREPSLPTLPVTFGDFARWQREWLQGEALDELLAPWLERLQGHVSPLALPTDRPRPLLRDSRGDHLALRFSNASWEGVRSLAARQGVTPFMVLLGVFATLLARLSGQRKFAVGSPVANRTQDSTQNLIGFFANTVVLPLSVSLDEAFPSFLASLRQISLFALGHQEVPLAKLVEALNPERDLAGTPLFQVMFALQEPSPGVAMEGLETELLSTTSGTSKFDLTLFLAEGAGDVRGLLEYSNGLFDRTTAERLGSYFERLLVSLLEESSRTVGELELLAPVEQHQLLRTWNGLPAQAEKTDPVVPVHQLFVDQAARNPDAEAIVWRDESTTYGELERRSAQLGAWLRQQRLGGEALVAVSMERKPELIATLLGVLRAGSVYVPLDPAYPPERTRYILEDSRAQLVLSGQPPPNDWVGCPWHDLSELKLPILGLPDSGIPSEGCRQEELAHLAYVIYTSGSTGRPKGVAITHGSAGEFVRWAGGVFAEEARGRILASTSVCFDLSIFEIFLPLSVGGQIALVDDALALAGDSAPKSVTLVNTVPSAAAELLRLKALPTSVRVVNLAGEALQQELVDRLHQETSVERVYNLYGPSEDTTYSTYALMERGPEGEPIIGWPVDETHAYVIDAESRLVPPEVQGELCLAGKGLARGYYRRPAETAAAFGPDPFAKTAGARLYRTGDLVTRRRLDGALQYRGRRDDQVKIRGYRIEPGEIEAVLGRYPEIARVAVTVAGSGARRSLVAHVVPDHGRLNDERWLRSLRAILEKQLPAPMIPSSWRLVEALPLTPSGKIDRKVLAADGLGGAAGSGGRLDEQPGAGLPPETESQQKLATLWSSALGVEELFQSSDFFQLGGHSLLATQVVAGIREDLCADFPLDAFFRAPTLKDQADLIDTSLMKGPGGGSPRPREREPRLPLSFAQERIWFLQQLDPDSSVLVIPAAFRLRGELQLEPFVWAVRVACERHEVLRTAIVVRQSTPWQEILPSVPLPLSVIDLQGLEAEHRPSAARSVLKGEASLPVNLAVPPLFRLRLLRLDQRESWLLLSIHHCIADGWSLQVLMRDLSTLYQDRLAGRSPSLASLPFHYGDYALWQREVAQEEQAEDSWSSSLSYWQEQLAAAPRALELPADRPRPAPASRRPTRRMMELPSDLEDRLKALCRSRGLTPFMVLLSCFKVLLARLSGQRDVVVGAPVANRGRAGLKDQVGIYLNTLALRTDVSDGITFQDLLASVQKMVKEGIAHQEVPFEAVLSCLPERPKHEQAPLFLVLFNMLSFARAPRALEGLALEEISVPDPPAKFDLTVYVREEPHFRLDWVFDEHLFSDLRIETMVAQYGQLLEGLVADPSASVENVPLSLPDDGLPDWTKPLDGGFETSLGDRFLEQAAAHAERAAVTDAKGSFTYGELEEYSGRLAGSLLESGLHRGDLVAVLAHRSKELLAALLGILRAGGRFVILDSEYPEEMLARRLRGLPVRAWISTGPVPKPRGDLAAMVNALPPSLRWQLPGPLPTLASVSQARASEPGDLLYLTFTSGSSGEPKKVQAKQRPLAHFLDWQAETFELGAQDRFSFLSGLGHDPALRDLFAPLWSGGCLVIPDPARITEPGWLADWLQREKISVTHLTPSLSQILEGASRVPQRLAVSLRWAFFGGEALKRTHVQGLRRLAPQARCINFYGATETPQAMAWEEVGEAPQEGGIAIGRGIRSAQALVLSTTSGLPCGVGELGEIGIRTPYLSEGYLGDEVETRRRFVAHPGTGDSGDRIYLTGDLGRFLPDGRVVVVSRRDDQLSIRGFRVEPGEVEAAILELSDQISAVAVVARRSPDAAVSGLVAFVILEPGETLAQEVWRTQLLDSLPTYMVPGRFEGLESLPRTPNGKVDRRALEKRAAGEKENVDRLVIAPKNSLEATLIDLWQEVLGQERLSTEDDFFALGGHSLLATRLAGRIQEVLGRDLALREFLDEPTIAGLARRLQDSDHEAPSSLPQAMTSPQECSQPFPLTEIQEAYWVGRAGGMELGGVASHRYLELESRALDLSRVERIWQRVIEQHPMLRAVILPDGRQQILSDVPPYRIETLDLSMVVPSEAEATLGELRKRMSHQMLDIETWPLFEIRAAKLAGGRSRLFISFDYLIADAWSFRLLLRDFLTLYEDDTGSLEAIPLTFRDYVLAAQEVKESKRYRRAKEYWQRRIPRLPSGPELPQSMSAENLHQQRFVRRNFRLPEERWTLLKDRAATNGFSPSCLLMTAFGEVLGAWSRTQRFSLVLTLFNRLPVHPDVARIVGDFTSTTLLVLERRPGETFVDRAQRCQRQLWEDLDHRFFSGVEVVREMGRERGHQGRGATPIVFTSTLDVSSAEDPKASPQLPGEVVHSVSQTPQVLLDHQVSEDSGELSLNWDAVEAAFPPELIDEMFSAYRGLIDRLVEKPDSWQRPFAGALQRDVLEAAEALPESAEPLTLLTGFLRQASENPTKVALCSRRRQLTYGELEQESACIASKLQDMGVRRGELVAVVAEKGWEQAVATLGILRAGAAYLPMDPTWPADRMQRVLGKAGSKVAVWASSAVTPESLSLGIETLEVSEGKTKPSSSSEALPQVEAEDLAYVIFTSGSTGMPKGVTVDHRSALNTCVDINRRFGVGPDDCVLALSSLSFDLSVYDLFGAFSCGARVSLPEEEEVKDPAGWLRRIQEDQVTIWNSVPALLELFADFLEQRDIELPSGLRLALLSGDWIPLNLPGRIRALRTDAPKIVSLGGATEGSIWSILYPIGAVDPGWPSIPYGSPMSRQSVLVLDAEMEPTPTWVTGDLYLGGAGVALGYWGDPARTARSFLPHPETGERLYRTGDLGRLLGDGTIEFQGRQDAQVKVRGYRIELGEVEAALSGVPGARVVVAAAVGSDLAHRRLVAYFVGPAEEDELRAHATTRLPPYMVPEAFVPLESIPLTANGKVDRRALPDPAIAAGPPKSRSYVAPRTPVEEALVEVVETVLTVKQLGVHDSIFDFGASSVTAIQLISRIREHFQVEVPLRRLFDGPTVAELAEAVLEAQTEQVDEAEMSGLLAELEGLSDEEVQRLLELERDEEKSA